MSHTQIFRHALILTLAIAVTLVPNRTFNVTLTVTLTVALTVTLSLIVTVQSKDALHYFSLPYDAYLWYAAMALAWAHAVVLWLIESRYDTLVFTFSVKGVTKARTKTLLR